MDRKTYWELIHEENYPNEVSWFQKEPTLSLEFIQKAAPDRASRILDVGCGQSGAAGPLVALGYTDVTAMDIAPEALERGRQHAGDAAERVTWVEADVLEYTADRPFDVWHDRAVLHFFLEEPDRMRYLESLKRNLAPGGHAIIATFAPDGPDSCSGLPVRRHSPEDIAELLADDFELLAAEHEVHKTPWNKPQAFQWTLFRRK